jgi:hypothetical protein
MKNILHFFLALFSLHSFAQPFVLECKLHIEYLRNNIPDSNNTGLWCNSCVIAVKVERKNVLEIHNVFPSFSYFYNTDDKVNLDVNGFARAGSWSIDKQSIKADNRIFEYSKEVGYVALKIDRLTGNFFATRSVPNPIGAGKIEDTMTGACRSKQAAF